MSIEKYSVKFKFNRLANIIQIINPNVDNYGWKASTSLEDGLRKTYKWYGEK